MSQINTSQRNTQNPTQSTNYPPVGSHKEKILVVIKTYPHPSISHTEIVCTAGVTEKGQWIRLYPVTYRYLEYINWYKKYQWIEAVIEKHNKDSRIDSYRPNIKTIRPLGPSIDTKRNWEVRKKILLPTLGPQSIEELIKQYKLSSISLGMFKPKKMLDFIIEPDTRDWSEKHKQVQSQLKLFGDQPKMLEKIPFKFSYVFLCKDKSCVKPHKMAIYDWEVYSLYRTLTQEKPFSMDIILNKMKQKWLGEMWRNDKDSYLIVGTTYPFPSFIVLGVFWPKKV